MTHRRRFRFAMQVTSAPTASAWTSLARRFEDEGYAVLSLPDHLGTQFAPVPAIAFAAAVTKDVRLGMFVLANDLRHPGVLAKEITTLDVLSGGRVELGVGAGWNKTEFLAQGVGFDPHAVRVERLAEAVTILKRAFAGDSVSFEGVHYRVQRSPVTGWGRPPQWPTRSALLRRSSWSRPSPSSARSTKYSSNWPEIELF